MRAIIQMILGSPVGPAEVREMTVRHVLAAPMDQGAAPITGALFGVYRETWIKTFGDETLVLIPRSEVEQWVMNEFANGFKTMAPDLDAGGYFVWPRSIPGDLDRYPADVLAPIAMALGEQVGMAADETTKQFKKNAS